ncbi:hypothetical protein [Fimbriiglobus ruber]|uniref:Uncharacterized protein n=1 Tax=Fimbriiglobus ruber TaxID=1908690 RepID=A0A225DXE1_9BACT|nr:hypothetical protein [Fimbriiglobus ruber]OWK43188.1 hypothetical protein FRUB_02787 [Fimbriiglobus ruber]
MNTSHNQRDDGQEELPTVSQVIRASVDAAQAARPQKPEKNDDERISLFWRVFGGTILSISALVVVTLYNNITNTLADLRSEVNKINEARADLIRKDEFNSRMSSNWERMQALQKDANAQSTTLTGLKTEYDGLKERVTHQGVETEVAKKEATTALDALKKEQVTVSDAVKKTDAAIDALKERLATLGTDLRIARDDVQRVRSDLDRDVAMDVGNRDRQAAQLKQYEEAMKELQHGLQDCREKLARLEGLYGPPAQGTPMPKRVGPPQPAPPAGNGKPAPNKATGGKVETEPDDEM